jgi:hypothetical protein
MTSQAIPSQVLDLNNWYLTLPIGEPRDSTDIYNPELQTFQHPVHFHVNDENDAVVFSCFSGGATTRGSFNPRSELRETFGSKLAWWSANEGVHTMTFTGCTTLLPRTRPSTVIGQVHRGADDVIEVRCWIPRRSTKHVIDVFHDNINYGILCPDYTLGTKYTIKIMVSDSNIKIFYDDMELPKLTVPCTYDRCFFKVGSYIQCNPVSHNARLDETTESWVYSVDVAHS